MTNNYHHLSYEERCKVNYDHPDSFDTDLMIEHIKKLKNGESVEEPVYDYTVHNRDKTKTIKLEQTEIIIIDGILILAEKELCDLMDLKIFVDLASDERLVRRIRRFMSFGQTMDEVTDRYIDTVRFRHDELVEPTRWHADMVINGSAGQTSVDILTAYIDTRLGTSK